MAQAGKHGPKQAKNGPNFTFPILDGPGLLFRKGVFHRFGGPDLTDSESLSGQNGSKQAQNSLYVPFTILTSFRPHFGKCQRQGWPLWACGEHESWHRGMPLVSKQAQRGSKGAMQHANGESNWTKMGPKWPTYVPSTQIWVEENLGKHSLRKHE